MTPDQEKRCRMFRLEPHLRKSAIMFLRIKFQSHRRGPRYSMDWQYDSFLRRQVYRILTHGCAWPALIPFTMAQCASNQHILAADHGVEAWSA